MTDACDWEGPAVFRHAEVVARKERPCVECNATILVGEKYFRYVGCWDGSWSGGSQHLLCRDACVWIRDVLNGECIVFGGLKEWWEETRRWSDCEIGRPINHPSSWQKPIQEKRIKANWRIGARMFAMVRRRERLEVTT